VGFVAIYFLIWGRYDPYLIWLRRMLVVNKSGQRLDSVALVILTFVCLGLGVVIEDFSDIFAEEDDAWYSWCTLFTVVPDNHLKVDTLFDTNFNWWNKRDEWVIPEPNPLARSFARHDQFSTESPKYGTAVEEYLDVYIRDRLGTLSENETLKEAATELRNVIWKDENDFKKYFERASRAVYYAARNRVSREATYFQEVRRIQDRIDFSRSCAFVAAFMGYFSLLGLFGVFRPFGARTSANKVTFLKVCLFSLLLHFVFVLTYVREEEQHNYRVYGYFNSILQAVEHDGATWLDSKQSSLELGVRIELPVRQQLKQ